MEQKTLLPFSKRKVRLERKSTDLNTPWRTFKLTCVIKQVNTDSVVIFTDHIGVIALSEIVAVEDLGDGGQ